jgi:type IV secretory pathway VirB3-like protein
MKAADRLIAGFFLFLACLVWPLLSLANRPAMILGIPVLILYLFAVWAAIVGVLIAATCWRQPPGDRT